MRNLQNQFKIYGNTAIRHMQTSNRLDLDKKCRAHLLLDHARIVLLRHCRIFAVTVARSHVRMRNRRKKKKYMGHHARPARKSPSGANRGPALLSQRVRVRNQFSSRRKHACVPPKSKQLHWNASSRLRYRCESARRERKHRYPQRYASVGGKYIAKTKRRV